MTWPGGMKETMVIDGRARDAVTLDPSAPPEVVATAATTVGIGPARRIESIAVTPDRDRIEELIGSRGGGHLRGALDDVLPGERSSGSPLYLLLDDISGASLIAGFVWTRWGDGPAMSIDRDSFRSTMEGVCIGFAPGSSSLTESFSGKPTHRVQPVGSLVHPDDPHGWHDLADLPEISMRRARRIDVSRTDDGDVLIDAAFQDSAGDPDRGRIAVHEYRLSAVVDGETMTLRSVDPDARILPFMECPGAVSTASVVVGAPVAELRAVVLERLATTNGCTHLNDALRALAEVPVLLAHLDAAHG